MLARLGGAEPIAEGNLTFDAEPEAAVAEADFVQENAPEREALKRQLLRRIEAVLPASVIIASSSSGLLMTDLQADCRHPERCVIGHPFNRPHLVPLVEVVAGARTSRPPSSARSRSMPGSESGRFIFAAKLKLKGMSLIGCKQRCGAKLSISSRSAWPASPISTPRSARGPGLRWD
jgi:3-hydroxyacyl-CoA dehydrogenase, NAD binding domain